MLLLGLAACGSPKVHPPRALAPYEMRFLRPSPLPGCTRAEMEALDARLQAISIREVPGDEGPSIAPEGPAVVQGIRAAWSTPCLAHLRRVLDFPLPESPENAGLAEGVVRDVAMANGLNVERDGQAFFVVPSMPRVPLTIPDSAAIAPWRCVPDDASCGARARSYITRAEQEWDAEEVRAEETRRRQRTEPDETCRAEAAITGRLHTPFERWARCVVREAPETYRYAPLRYRVPDRGWLLLRGTRGHHFGVVEELRAYDLASGAAYVASIPYEHPLELTVLAGRVSAEQAREVAFTLGTARAVTPTRIRAQLEPRPPGLAVTFSGADFLGPDDRSWHDSGQTKLDFLLFATEAPAAGELTWPGSSVAWENHADTLLEVLEAGLERGCAPAALPRGALDGLPAVSFREPAAMQRRLAEALVAFRPPPCQ